MKARQRAARGAPTVTTTGGGGAGAGSARTPPGAAISLAGGRRTLPVHSKTVGGAQPWHQRTSRSPRPHPRCAQRAHAPRRPRLRGDPHLHRHRHRPQPPCHAAPGAPSRSGLATSAAPHRCPPRRGPRPGHLGPHRFVRAARLRLSTHAHPTKLHTWPAPQRQGGPPLPVARNMWARTCSCTPRLPPPIG